MIKRITMKFAALCVAFSLATPIFAEVKGEGQEQINEQMTQMGDEIEELKRSLSTLQSTLEETQAKVVATESFAKQGATTAQTSNTSKYAPNVFGTVMVTLNVSTYNGLTRFNVRNSRFGVKGLVSNDLSYAIQVDFHNQGSVSILDSYVKYKRSNFEFVMGQQQIHLTRDFDRGPSSNLFSSRSLAAVYATTYVGTSADGGRYVNSLGSRDIGASVKYNFDTEIPVSLSFGAFNGTGINNPEWDRQVNYVGRVTLGGSQGLFAGASYYQGETPIEQKVKIYSAETAYSNEKLFVEATYQHRKIADITKTPMRLAVVQGYYTIDTPKSKVFESFAPTLRWDYGNEVGYLSTANDTTSNSFTIDFATPVDIHRISAAFNFRLVGAKIRSRLSVGYEKYFMDYDAPDMSYNPLCHDKFTMALIAAF